MIKKIKRKVREHKPSFYEEELEATLGEVLEVIDRLIKAYGKDAYFYSTRMNYDDYDKLHLFVDRDETPEERHQRKTKEQEYERQRIERDRKEFERLKKKFGDTQ